MPKGGKHYQPTTKTAGTAKQGKHGGVSKGTKDMPCPQMPGGGM